MKKLFPKILIVCLVLLVAFAVVACDKQEQETEPDAPIEYETATYTVTYKSDCPTDSI